MAQRVEKKMGQQTGREEGGSLLNSGRILILGNSITWHGPSADVDWFGSWGMAASCLEKDYVHVLIREISELTGRAPEWMAENIADFERQFETFDIEGNYEKYFQFKADLVILAIGENVPELPDEGIRGKFKNAMLNLMAALKKRGNPAILVRGCFMPHEVKDNVMKDACAEAGGIYVDIMDLGKEESNYARSEREYKHAGVAGHPGDKGMKAIADAILKAMRAGR
jgi:hypothetical protein